MTLNIDPIRVSAPRTLLAQAPTITQRHSCDVLIIGSGVAGLSAALLAGQSASVMILERGTTLRESNSAWAQGGVAAALDESDTPDEHVQDTLIAGAGLSDPAPVEQIARAAPDVMRTLAAAGVPFERVDANHFALGLEGGHGHRRILHAGGDATGWALTATLAKQVMQMPQVQLCSGMTVADLLVHDGGCQGVLARDQQGAWHIVAAKAIILATGGAGAIYGITSNPSGALGTGIALAYRAGAAIADMEFVQFHPTILRTSDGRGFLMTEALRGEGAHLLTLDGRRFMPNFDPRAELAPRDVVSRGIFAAMQQSSSDHVLLDITHLDPDYIERRFPTILAACRAEGIDPLRQHIPVAPAAHYLMGGVCTDLDGRTTLPGLYAAGECACTGVHGANRLASNSLLECLVFGQRAAQAALDRVVDAPEPRPDVLRYKVEQQRTPRMPDSAWRAQLGRLMREHVGLLRNAEGLQVALQSMNNWPLQAADALDETLAAANAGLVAQLMAAGGLMRTESRGAHQRSDYPTAQEAWRAHLVQQHDASPTTVAQIIDAIPMPNNASAQHREAA